MLGLQYRICYLGLQWFSLTASAISSEFHYLPWKFLLLIVYSAEANEHSGRAIMFSNEPLDCIFRFMKGRQQSWKGASRRTNCIDFEFNIYPFINLKWRKTRISAYVVHLLFFFLLLESTAKEYSLDANTGIDWLFSMH